MDTNSNYISEGVLIEGYRHEGVIYLPNQQEYASMDDVLGYFPNLEPFLESELVLTIDGVERDYITPTTVLMALGSYGYGDE